MVSPIIPPLQPTQPNPPPPTDGIFFSTSIHQRHDFGHVQGEFPSDEDHLAKHPTPENSSERGELQMIKGLPRKHRKVPLFLRRLWLVLGVKLMEIDSKWFSRYLLIMPELSMWLILRMFSPLSFPTGVAM